MGETVARKSKRVSNARVWSPQDEQSRTGAYSAAAALGFLAKTLLCVEARQRVSGNRKETHLGKCCLCCSCHSVKCCCSEQRFGLRSTSRCRSLCSFLKLNNKSRFTLFAYYCNSTAAPNLFFFFAGLQSCASARARRTFFFSVGMFP